MAVSQADCLEIVDVPTEFSFAEPAPDGSDSTHAWQGETIWFSEVAGSSLDRCPDVIDRGLPFIKRINGRNITFYTRGGAIKIRDVGWERDGTPHALYDLQDEFHETKDNYRAWGGTLMVGCKRRTLLTFAGVRFQMRLFQTYDYVGDIIVGASGSAGGGWGYVNQETGYQNGIGDGWQEALNGYLSGGYCTPGWDIWVDGVQKCGNGRPITS